MLEPYPALKTEKEQLLPFAQFHVLWPEVGLAPRHHPLGPQVRCFPFVVKSQISVRSLDVTSRLSRRASPRLL